MMRAIDLMIAMCFVGSVYSLYMLWGDIDTKTLGLGMLVGSFWRDLLGFIKERALRS